MSGSIKRRITCWGSVAGMSEARVSYRIYVLTLCAVIGESHNLRSRILLKAVRRRNSDLSLRMRISIDRQFGRGTAFSELGPCHSQES